MPAAPAHETRLARELRTGESRRSTPLDAFQLARSKWFKGERIDIGAMAGELGVGRATLFRWIGSKEKLLGEVLWSLYGQLLADIDARIRIRGPRRIAAVMEEACLIAWHASASQRFLQDDPEYVMRLLTSKAGPFQDRVIAAVRDMIEREAAQGALTLSLPADTLAFLVVRVAESVIYGEFISGRKQEPTHIGLAIELLLSGHVEGGAGGRSRARHASPQVNKKAAKGASRTGASPSRARRA